MKKKLFCLLICGLLIATPVFAENTESGNSTTSGNNSTTGSENSDLAAEARAKRLVIKSQTKELAQLRVLLKTKIAEKKVLMNQYREQERLTTEQRLEVKSMIQSMKTVQDKLGAAYQNAVRSMSDYKGDKSSNKLTGLDSVIASQKERITLLEETIAELE